MTWAEIRTQYPESWVVVEAFGAFTDKGKRVINHVELIASFGDDWESAWERYKSLHHADKRREYYMIHTHREDMDIGVIDAFGRVLS